MILPGSLPAVAEPLARQKLALIHVADQEVLSHEDPSNYLCSRAIATVTSRVPLSEISIPGRKQPRQETGSRVRLPK